MILGDPVQLRTFFESHPVIPEGNISCGHSSQGRARGPARRRSPTLTALQGTHTQPQPRESTALMEIREAPFPPAAQALTHIRGPHDFQLQHRGKSQPAAKNSWSHSFANLQDTAGLESWGRREGRGGMTLLCLLSIPPPSLGCIPADVKVDRAASNKPRTWGVVSSCAQLVQLARFTAALRGSSASPVDPGCPKHEVKTSPNMR